MKSYPKGLRRRQAILEYIADYIEEYGYGPSVREIAEGTGLRSTAAAHYHIVALQREGLLTDPGVRARAMRVVEQPR